MIFYVYFDPEVIPLAQREGPYAMQSLIAILRGFLQNCFVLGFEDNRLEAAIDEQVGSLPEDWDRTTLKKVFGAMRKRHLFIDCLVPDYLSERTDLACALAQAKGLLIDLLLIREELAAASGPDGVQFATLGDYQRTYFEEERSRLAAEGCALEDSEMDENEFLDGYLKKALRYARRIEICDKMLGKKYSDNYQYTVRTLLVWLEQALAEPGALKKIIFHCSVPDDEVRGSIDVMKQEIGDCRRGRLTGLSIDLQFYDGDGELPHDRFIITDQVTIGIPRGMDFLNRRTGRIRDLTLDYKSRAEIEKILKSYEHAKGDLIVL